MIEEKPSVLGVLFLIIVTIIILSISLWSKYRL